MLWASWRKVPKSADRYAGAELRWSCSVIKAQCQTILLHTSFKLRFNGHIITFSPMKFKQFQPNPFARSIYPRSQITMWGFAWHFQGLGICHRNTARLTAAPREKTKTRTRSRITSEEKGVCVCVCVCAQRGSCFGGERTCCCLPVRCSVFRWGTDACVLPGAPLPAAGASRRQWPPPCSSRWSRRKAAPSHYSASPAHTQPETHTQSEVWTWSFTNTITSEQLNDRFATYWSSLLSKLRYEALFWTGLQSINLRLHTYRKTHSFGKIGFSLIFMRLRWYGVIALETYDWGSQQPSREKGKEKTMFSMNGNLVISRLVCRFRLEMSLKGWTLITEREKQLQI